jgi:hypothetical protein
MYSRFAIRFTSNKRSMLFSSISIGFPGKSLHPLRRYSQLQVLRLRPKIWGFEKAPFNRCTAATRMNTGCFRERFGNT